MPKARPTFRLVLASVAVALGGLAVPPAHADTAPTCPLSDSTVVAEFDTLRGYHTRIAYFSPFPTELDVCVQSMGSIQSVIAVTSELGVTPPTTAVSTDAGDCANVVVDVTDPVPLTLSYDAGTGARVVCFGIDGTTTSMTWTPAVVGAVPTVAIWLPANSFLNQWGWCLDRYALYAPHHTKSHGDEWRQCYQRDNRVG